MIIQSGMNIKIRTEEECDVFVEVATKEGHRWRGGRLAHQLPLTVPQSISVGYNKYDIYPNDLSHDRIDFCGGNATNVVEASDLFRNQLISKRLKGEKSEKESIRW